MVRRLFSYIGEGGHIPHEWFAAEVARLDNVNGDIEALADRLAGVRSWAYIAHRSDWLKDPPRWAERTQAVEGRLSDALHSALTQRFVDRRTAVLIRDIGARGADALPITVAADGEVSVGPEPIGHLAGFEFSVDPAARHADKRMLLAAAERRLGAELDRRAKALLDAPDSAFSLEVEEGGGLAIGWDGSDRNTGPGPDRHILARLAAGRSLLEPAVRTVRALDRLSAPRRAELRVRLEAWIEADLARHVGALTQLARAASDRLVTPGVRALAAMLADAGGLLPRRAIAQQIAALDKADRQSLHRHRLRLGALDLFVPTLLKPKAQRWRAALLAIRSGQPMPRLPDPGAATLDGSADPRGAGLAFRRFGSTWLRVDIADRIAAHAHAARQSGAADPLDRGLITSLGLDDPAVTKLMAEIGFIPAGDAWKWRGYRPVRRNPPVQAIRPGNAFAALAELKRR
jgi:ATP-dependent RNA helicase SUPV3L1/SUV3